ncbi:hypothetical protein GO986_00935 [Deinococcus sp. HMF7620]|uniref:SCP domain-containing protein n=1 Tax=Deinococcus arboris TaxID=2682977 RepID=A0A7C9HVI8_9DEIO|nr:DUF6174 domain-containing protein [Deinococcus arboris]MVN85330.1 hypothetical protein [Deinococcus arboris]
MFKLPAAALLGLLMTAAPLAQAGGAGGPVPASGVCRPGYVRPDFVALNRQLRQARTLWQAQGLKTYRYDVRQVAAPVLFPTTRVTVRGGQVTGTALAPGESGEPSPLARLTLEGRFDTVAQILREQARARCPDVRVSYDPALGFPVLLYSGLGDGGIADGFGEWTVTNFTPLQ